MMRGGSQIKYKMKKEFKDKPYENMNIGTRNLTLDNINTKSGDLAEIMENVQVQIPAKVKSKDIQITDGLKGQSSETANFMRKKSDNIE